MALSASKTKGKDLAFSIDTLEGYIVSIERHIKTLQNELTETKTELECKRNLYNEWKQDHKAEFDEKLEEQKLRYHVGTTFEEKKQYRQEKKEIMIHQEAQRKEAKAKVKAIKKAKANEEVEPGAPDKPASSSPSIPASDPLGIPVGACAGAVTSCIPMQGDEKKDIVAELEHQFGRGMQMNNPFASNPHFGKRGWRSLATVPLFSFVVLFCNQCFRLKTSRPPDA
jgi:hypothetical protein